ncbi:MAG: ATP-binding protein [Ktedonobacteraceae bacterium]
MSNAIWGDPKPTSDEQYPLKLLTELVQDMLKQVSAYGACLALYDESINQMVVRLHLRRCKSGNNQVGLSMEQGAFQVRPALRRNTMKLADKLTPLPAVPTSMFPEEECFENVQTTSGTDLLPVGSAYPLVQDLIGATWYHHQSYHLSHERYQTLRASSHQPPIQEAFTPSWYLTLPLNELEQSYEDIDRKHPQNYCPGVLVLYQIQPTAGFQEQQAQVAQQHAERISLYLQNDRLRRLQFYTRDHVKQLQQISTTFPNSLRLSDLVEEVFRFVHNTVDVSSMLLTLYDRDTRKLYDIFALNRGVPIEGLTEQPVIIEPDARPHWWQIAQKEKRTLLLSLDSNNQTEAEVYADLLTGTWGDQRGAETFLLIPMKMFTRVVGSLCITSQRPHAYSSLDILVLETMVQIVTVALENAKLYERPRLALKQSKRREESLASTISALQAISTVLNVSELLHKFVQIVANLVEVEMCSFFQLMPNEDELVAQAIFDRTGKWKALDGARQDDHEELINMIHLPFKGSLLAEMVNEAFFYVDASNIEAIAQASGESGAIFLREIDIQKMLVIPVRYQTTDLVGIVVIHLSQPDRLFQPEEISILMAISAQAAGAIRNAQLFEQIQEANAELQRMDRVKDEFIMTASHELRTPLSAISGYSSLLKKQGENGRANPQQNLKFANKIVDATQQLKDLVDNMTQAARMGALDKKLELQLVPSQLLAATEMATTMLNINIEQVITVDIAADLWVNSDTLRLRQVITNLLDNAAKYSPPRGRILIAARATNLSKLPENQVDYTNILTSEADPEVIVIRVCDEGDGIAPEDIEKIFDKFVRAPRSLTTSVRGTGLGLFICRRFIEAMGGRLWLEVSRPGKGSIFSFYLMRVSQPTETREHDEPESDTTETSLYSTPENISR